MALFDEGDTMDLQGKTALITGGTTGIGFATARSLIAAGAHVVITGQDEGRLDTATRALGADTRAYAADVCDLAALRAVRDAIARDISTIDILFANAGVAYATPLAETDEALYDRIMATNVKGVFFTVQTFVPLMPPGGSIVLNTSWLDQVGTAGLSVLSASKAAVRSLTRTLAAELWPLGLRVNAVSPGAIDTPIHSKTGMPPEAAAEFAARIQQAVPMGRFGRAEEVAAAVTFLSGSGASYMLGAEMVVDGGFSQL